MNVLSRYLSHALVLVIAIAIGAYAAPGAVALQARFTGSTSALAASGIAPGPRTAVLPGGCQAPPAIPSGATVSQIGALQAQVQARMNGCAARIEALNRQLSALDRSIVSQDQRIGSERQLLAGLARDLYRRPQSIVVALATSRSLGEFLTGVADMQSAGARATQLTDQMQADESQLRSERAAAAATRHEQLSARQSLAAASHRLDQLYAMATYSPVTQAAWSFVIPPGKEQVVKYIEAAFQPLGQSAVYWALRVARCESNYNPNAVNPYSGTEGLFQFMPSTWRGTPYGKYNVFSAKYNSLGAAWLYSQRGGSPWQCS